jgi:hypothetical protein
LPIISPLCIVSASILFSPFQISSLVEQHGTVGALRPSAVARVGQAVNLAVERFVTVGEAIADDYPEVRQGMYEACKEARQAGKFSRSCYAATSNASLLTRRISCRSASPNVPGKRKLFFKPHRLPPRIHKRRGRLISYSRCRFRNDTTDFNLF